MKKQLKVFSAFTGIGCAEIALKENNIDVINIGISEVDRYALLAYDSIHNGLDCDIIYPSSKEEMIDYFKEINIAYNFSTNKNEIPKNINDVKKLYKASINNNNYGDIRKINPKNIPDFDLFTYSFPCKNISIIGKQDGLRKGSDTQSSLLWECEKIIKEKKPKYLQMENVKNLVGSKHISELNEWIEVLNKLGYKSTYKVLNASNFSTPQNRKRVIMISVLGDEYPDFKTGNKTFMSIEDITQLDQNLNLLYKQNDYELFNNISIESGKLIHIGNINGKPHANKRIYHTRGYSPTLNSMNGGNRQPKVYNGKNTRRLNPLECWRLMGLKDEYFYKAKNAGLSDSKLYERAGRGIVIPMLRSVFDDIIKGYNNDKE
jgi:DNA (cytosine-5)-methyltransferase 1